MSTRSILEEIAEERTRQEMKWGQQDHLFHHNTLIACSGSDLEPARFERIAATFYDVPYVTAVKLRCDEQAKVGTTNFATILLEEVLEALNEHDERRIRAELLQVAAVAVGAMEAIDRRLAAAASGE